MKFEVEDCPHCAGPGQIKDIPTPYRHGWVGCPVCGIYKQWSYRPDEAIKTWNARKKAISNNSVEVKPC